MEVADWYIQEIEVAYVSVELRGMKQSGDYWSEVTLELLDYEVKKAADERLIDEQVVLDWVEVEKEFLAVMDEQGQVVERL